MQIRCQQSWFRIRILDPFEASRILLRFMALGIKPSLSLCLVVGESECRWFSSVFGLSLCTNTKLWHVSSMQRKNLVSNGGCEGSDVVRELSSILLSSIGAAFLLCVRIIGKITSSKQRTTPVILNTDLV